MCSLWQNTSFECDKSMLAATRLLSWQNSVCRDKTFVMTNRCLSWQRFCHDKHTFVVTILCSRDTYLPQRKFIVTNINCVATKHVFVATKLLSHQKWYLWQLLPMIWNFESGWGFFGGAWGFLLFSLSCMACLQDVVHSHKAGDGALLDEDGVQLWRKLRRLDHSVRYLTHHCPDLVVGHHAHDGRQVLGEQVRILKQGEEKVWTHSEWRDEGLGGWVCVWRGGCRKGFEMLSDFGVYF